jgi:hypothetical protein
VSAVHAIARRHSVSSHHVIEILATMEIVDEDRPALFCGWLDARLAGMAQGIRREARRWAVTVHDDGPAAQWRPGFKPGRLSVTSPGRT